MLPIALAVLFWLLFMPAMLVLHFYLEALAIFHLWEWFIVPLGVKAIGMYHAIGLGLIVSLMTIAVHEPRPKAETEEEKKADNRYWLLKATSLYARPLVTLLIGYVIHCLMV